MTGDFDLNNSSDILWWKDENGLVKLKIWHMDGTQCIDEVDVSSPGTPDSNWEIQGVGDFDGDKDADILWRHAKSRKIVIWIMDGAAHVGGNYVDYTACDNPLLDGWEIRGTGDFNNDEKADILFQHQSLGSFDIELKVWYMDGLKCKATALTYGHTAGAWKSFGGGYFTSDPELDGVPDTDVLFRNETSGKVVIWYLDGFFHDLIPPPGVISGEFTDPDGATTLDKQNIVAMGQYGEHACTDILWRDINGGKLEAWLMEGHTRLSTQPIQPCSQIYTDPTWHAVGPH